MLSQMAICYPFLWLSNIPLYIPLHYTNTHTHIHIYTYTYIYHFFFIHLYGDGQDIDCFHILATVNNAAMNIQVHIYLFKLVLLHYLDKYPEVK